MVKVDFKFDKLYSCERNAEVCQIAVPIEKGSLFFANCANVFKKETEFETQENENNLNPGVSLENKKKSDNRNLENNSNRVQTKVTSRWEDGSIRWILVRFLADLPANKGIEYTCILSDDNNKEPMIKKNMAKKKGDIITVNTGAISFYVSDNSDTIFKEVSYEGRTYNENSFIGPNLVEGNLELNGKTGVNLEKKELNSHSNITDKSKVCNGSNNEEILYKLHIDKWKIVEDGNVCTILEGEGRHIYSFNNSEDISKQAVDTSNTIEENEKALQTDKQINFTVRLTAYVDKPWIEVAYRIFNTTDNPLYISELNFRFNNYGVESIEKYNENIEHKDKLSIRRCVATSNYGTYFDMGEDGKPLEKVIDSQYLLYDSNEHMAEVFYGTFFGDYTDSNQGGICATIYQAYQNYPKAIRVDESGMTVMIVPKSIDKVIMQSGMAREQRFLLHFHGNNTSLEDIDNRSLIYQMEDRPRLSPDIYKNAKVFEDVFVENKAREIEAVLIIKADSHARCYGMLNWGDAPDAGYTLQGRGNGAAVWTNNEYDYPHACALMYARTSTRRFLDYMLVAASHWMDVDICHYSKNPLHLHGQWEHTNGHTINGQIVCSHQWVEGLIDYYHFTGDERALEAATEIGHNVERLLETPMFKQKGEINARETGWALRSLVALFKETHDEKWLEKCDWIVGHFEQWEKSYGHWLSPYTDNTRIRVVFMISVAVGSLSRYYKIKPDEKIKGMILRAVDDLIENCILDTGLFFYKELPSLQRLGANTIVLEALEIAYRLTGNEKYLDAGMMTFKAATALAGVSMGGGAKRIENDAVINMGPGTKNFAQSFWPITTFYKAISDK